jgi:hypothetical protein
VSEDEDQKGKGSILSKALVGGFITLIVAIVSLVGNKYLQVTQEKEMKFRLYTELMAQREQAESALRKDMFTSIIESFMKSDTTSSTLDKLESKVLNLELLSYNFHESLDLKPLFLHLDRELRRLNAGGNIGSSEFHGFRERLHQAAREVKRKQISALAYGEGIRIDFVIPWYARNCATTDTTGYPVSPGDSTLCYHLGSRCNCCSEMDEWSQPDRDTSSCLRYKYHFCRAIDSLRHRFEIEAYVPRDTMDEIKFDVTVFVPKDTSRKVGCDCDTVWIAKESEESENVSAEADTVSLDSSLLAFLESKEQNLSPDTGGQPSEKAEEFMTDCVGDEPTVVYTRTFHVDQFDFPLIDNSRLWKDYRFSLVLDKFAKVNDTTAQYEMVLVCFPGSRAGLKDKPYIDDIMDKLVSGK